MEMFLLTGNHLLLLRRLAIDIDGGPFIDQKRPYGNSDVLGDIAEILHLPGRDENGEYPEGQEALMECFHREMGTVLEIIFRTGRIEAGMYRKKSWNEWEEV